MEISAHGEDKVVLVRKKVYYGGIVLFIEWSQLLVALEDVALVKANIRAFFHGFALK